jgi:hypothetical protein
MMTYVLQLADNNGMVLHSGIFAQAIDGHPFNSRKSCSMKDKLAELYLL